MIFFLKNLFRDLHHWEMMNDIWHDISKNCAGIMTKLGEWVGLVARTSRFDFCWGPDQHPAYQWGTKCKLFSLVELCTLPSAVLIAFVITSSHVTFHKNTKANAVFTFTVSYVLPLQAQQGNNGLLTFGSTSWTKTESHNLSYVTCHCFIYAAHGWG